MTKKRRITARVRGFMRSTRAVSALEYAILVGVVVVAVVAALTQFGNRIANVMADMSGRLSSLPGAGP